jgi:hypothetical protein
MFIEAVHGAAQMGLTECHYRPRPSMAGPERCLRQIVYKGLGVEGAPFSSRLAMVLRDGEAHERVSIDVLRHTLLHIHSEQHALDLHNALPWRAEYPPYTCSVCPPVDGHPRSIPATTLHGHLDYLGRDLYGEDHLGEHKGVVSHVFKRYWDGEKEPLDYFTQNVFYFRGLQEQGLPIHHGGLLIKNKDTSAYLEFELEYDYERDILTVPVITYAPGLEQRWINKTYEGLYHHAIEKFRLADRHIVERTLPDRLEDPDDSRCLYCPFDEICWAGYEPPPLTEDLLLPDHLLPVAKELLALEEELKPKLDRQDQLKSTLIKELTVLHATRASRPDIEVKLSASTQVRLDQERLPAGLKKAFSKTIHVQRLTVRRPKPVSNKTAARRRPTPGLPTVPSGTHQSAA